VHALVLIVPTSAREWLSRRGRLALADLLAYRRAGRAGRRSSISGSRRAGPSRSPRGGRKLSLDMETALRRLAMGFALSVAAACATPGADCHSSGACADDYVALPARLPGGTPGEPRSDAEIDALVAGLGEISPTREPLAPAELAREIEAALALEPLRRALREEIAVDVTGASEQRVVFHDPYVGTFEGILLLPDGPGPFPAVLALHGHRDRAETYRDLHHGRDYPAHGIALFMLTLRAMNLDADEQRAWHALLAHGLHLMGARIYEAERALAYLRARPEIDPNRIGLIGHSGGSSLGNLLVRIEPGLAAYVSDHTVDYRSKHSRHCEIVPGLVPLSTLIADFTTAPLPVLRVPYGYGRRRRFGRDKKEIARILDFFVERLSAR